MTLPGTAFAMIVFGSMFGSMFAITILGLLMYFLLDKK